MPQFAANARSKFVTLASMFAGLMICARLLAVTPSPPTMTEHVTCARSTRPVTCDVVRPVTTHGAPLIVLVHGRSGMSFYAERLNGLARRLAMSGFVVLIPHYFDATGDPDKPEMTDERFRVWLETLGQVIDFGSRLEGVDPKRVGLSGFSLGAYLSVTRAAGDARVGAVVSSSGGLPERLPDKVARMPPVLIIHADQDPIASPEDMRRLEKRLRENRISVEVLIYPSQDHILEGDAWNDAAGKMVEFLEKTLGMASSARAEMETSKPAPELKKLDYFVGTWTAEGEIKPGPLGPGGKFTATNHVQWMDGGFFLVTHSEFHGAMGQGTETSYMGYDSNDRMYTYDSFNSLGEASHARGNLDDAAWTWQSETTIGPQTMKGRLTIKMQSATAYDFRFDVSTDGTTWSTVMVGKDTKK